MRLQLKATLKTTAFGIPEAAATLLAWLGITAVPAMGLLPMKSEKEALRKLKEVTNHIEIFLGLLRKKTPIYLDITEDGWPTSLNQAEFEKGLVECFGYTLTPGSIVWFDKYANTNPDALIITNDSNFFRENRPLNRQMRDLDYGNEKYGDAHRVWPTNWLAVAILMTRDGLNRVDLRNAILEEYRINREVPRP